MMDPASTAERAKHSVMGTIGLIQFCRTILHAPGEPRMHIVSAIPSNVSTYAGRNIVGDTGAGGFTYQQALEGAIGECLERYSYVYYDPENLIFACQAELGDAAVGFDRFALYSEAQYSQAAFPFSRWRPDMSIAWVRGESLISGKQRFIPAQMVYLPYLPGDGEPLLCVPVSTGQACHPDRTQAILTALYEVVERDAFTISWLRKLPLPRLEYREDPALRQLYQRYLEGCQLEFHVFDMTMDIGIPSCLCVVEGRTARGPVVGIGAATRLTQREAVSKALLEAAQVMVWCRDLVRRRADWRPAPDWSNVFSFEDRVRLYCEPEMKQHLSFLLESPLRRTVSAEPPSPDALGTCLGAIEAAGFDCILVDTTPPDVADSGFHVPKIFIPGTASVGGTHQLQPLGSPRLWSVPAKLGYGDSASRELNPIPHPFP